MIPIQRFALRMTFATLALSALSGAYLLGYYVGYLEAERAAYFLPAVIVNTSD